MALVHLRAVGCLVRVLWIPHDAPVDATLACSDPHVWYYGMVEKVRRRQNNRLEYLVAYLDGTRKWTSPPDEEGFEFIQ